MPRRIVRNLSLTLVTLALPLVGCSDRGTESVVAASAPTPAVPSSSKPPADNGFLVSGPLIVEHQLDVLAQRDGVISKLLRDAGARVNAGDLLAQLDDRQLNADLQAAHAKTLSTEADLNNWKAEARVLQADYGRAQKMWADQLITQEQLDHAKFKAEADEWDVKRVEQLLVNARQSERSLELEMEKTRIRAPFSGIVARRYVHDGQQVAKGDRLFWVTAEGPLRMRFTLPEKFVGKLQGGQVLPLTTPDFPGRSYTAKVAEVSPVVDPASGTFEVVMELEGNPAPLRPGMTASVNLDHLQ
jgi:membrane fusion protein, multidrug efflux system